MPRGAQRPCQWQRPSPGRDAFPASPLPSRGGGGGLGNAYLSQNRAYLWRYAAFLCRESLGPMQRTLNS